MMNSQIGRPIEILLVEDNPGDVRLTIEALKEGKVYNNLSVVPDGEEAMEYMRKQGRHAEAIRPDLVLLDLNLHKKDGREVLIDIKTDDELKSIPVIILTSSQAEEDVLKAYNNYANCYVTKPVDVDQLFKIVKAIENFWLAIVKLPPGAR
jgi:CheY-like chemotaxis protein